jgi:uncharacterized protein (TIGR01777 family)
MVGMRIAVTGASGLIGSALTPRLRAAGHDVLRLVRRAPTAADEARWDPVLGTVDTGALRGVDAVVHLAGAGVAAHRWTAAYKRTLRDSRVRATACLTTALAALDPPPRTLLCGSAIGWYGDTGERAVDESAGSGAGFLAALTRDWERASEPASAVGMRVVWLRTGIVFARGGGAWARLAPVFRAGLGGRLGSGRQYWSFISLADEVAAIEFLLDAERVRGPVNLTAPHPVTNADATRIIAAALRRPALLPVPALALRAALGELSVEVLTSQRVLPTVLTGAGFVFQHPRFADAVSAL